MVFDDKYNWSAIHSERPAEEAIVMHFHGMKSIKRPRGRQYWMPYYERAKRENVANINDWTPLMPKLKAYLANPERYGGDNGRD
jgi:hypothetical protein